MFKVIKQILKNLFTAKHTVRVIYKSGATVDSRCYEFLVKRRGSEITEVEWRAAGVRRPLYINAGEISAIWQMD